MSPVTLSPPDTRRPSAPRNHSHARVRRGSSGNVRGAPDRPFARYLDGEGRPRELVSLSGYAGSVLVLDRDAITLSDRRLLAHLAADEPPENAALVCRRYLEHAEPPVCRMVQAEDLEVAPFGESGAAGVYDARTGAVGRRRPQTHTGGSSASEIVDPDGNSYRLRLLPGERATVQLRWCRRARGEREWERVSLRDVVAAIESYEPMRMLTERAIERSREDPGVVLTRLRWELERLSSSPVVLNRGLREAVLRELEVSETSMSELAQRCGAIKRNRHGKPSGETSWLARRIGIMPEGGERHRTPWVHSDVLAAIAREGLNISPREVELS
jgi:hypothetical protein